MPVLPVLLMLTTAPSASKAKLSGATISAEFVVHVVRSNSAMKVSLYSVLTYSGNSSE